MNTNEFRHPKERLQNLSSRHKVSCVLFCSVESLRSVRLRVGRRWATPERSGADFQIWVSMCVPVRCRLDVVQLCEGILSEDTVASKLPFLPQDWGGGGGEVKLFNWKCVFHRSITVETITRWCLLRNLYIMCILNLIIRWRTNY